MQYILSVIRTVFYYIRRAGSLVVGGRGSSWKRQTVLRYLHYTVLVLLTIFLIWLSRRHYLAGEFGNHPEILQPISPIYWAVLFWIGYIILRLSIWLIAVLFTRGAAEYEDIEEAWREAMEALERHDIPIDCTLLFLVLGLKNDAEETAFFEGARIRWKEIVPQQGPQPLRMYISDDALFVSLRRVGCVSAQWQQLEEDLGGSEPGSEGAPSMGPIPTGGQTLAPGQGMQPGMLEKLKQQASQPKPSRSEAPATMRPGGPPEPPVAEFRDEFDYYQEEFPSSAPGTMAGPSMGMGAGPSMGMGAIGPRESSPQRKLGVRPLKTKEKSEESSRLNYLCRLIRESRIDQLDGSSGDIPPINGAIVCLPISLSAGSNGREAMPVVTEDLSNLNHGLDLAFPVVVVETGLESIGGYHEFVSRGLQKERNFTNQRVGSRFTIGQFLDPSASESLIDRGVASSLRGVVYEQLASDILERTNRRLFRFYCDLDTRRTELATQLHAALGDLADPDAVRLAGCYFCATGSEKDDRAFLRDAIGKLISHQSDISWTDRRLSYNKFATTVAIGVFLIAFLLVAVEAGSVWMKLTDRSLEDLNLNLPWLSSTD